MRNEEREEEQIKAWEEEWKLPHPTRKSISGKMEKKACVSHLETYVPLDRYVPRHENLTKVEGIVTTAILEETTMGREFLLRQHPGYGICLDGYFSEALARKRVEIEVIDTNKMTSSLIVRVRETPRDDWSRIAEIPQERVTDPSQHDQLVQLNIKLIAGAIFRRFLMQDEVYVNLE